MHKPSGLLVQGDRSGDETLLDQVKDWLKVEFNKPGNVYLGLVHRLDRPTSGVVMLARTSKAACRLSEQFRQGHPQKRYRCIVHGNGLPIKGEWTDSIDRVGHGSRIVSTGGKQAQLTYKVLAEVNGQSLVEVRLLTGRHHQIRVQFAHRGFPVLGDQRYGSRQEFGKRSIALHAAELQIKHAIRTEILTICAPLPVTWPAWARGSYPG